MEHPRRELGPLDRVPGEARDGLEGAQEAADARGGLEGVDGLAVAREAQHERRDDAGDLLRDLARRVELVGEFPTA